MKISIAIITYNRAILLKETLISILNQSVVPSQIVIVDDGSTDNTEKVIRNLDSDIVYKRIENSGPAIARKTAIELCTGHWIALCDSDDIWDPEHIERFIQFTKALPERDVYFTNFSILGEPGSNKFKEAPMGWFNKLTEKKYLNDRFLALSEDLYEGILIFQPIFQSALIFKKELYERIGGISTELGRINSEDAHLTRRLIAYGKAGCATQPMVKIRKHCDNYSTSWLKNNEGRLLILKQLCNHQQIPEKYIKVTLDNIQASEIDLFNGYYWSNEHKKAINQFKQVGCQYFKFIEVLRYITSNFYYYKQQLMNKIKKRQIG